MRLTWLVLLFLFVRVLILRRLFDDLRLGLSLALGLPLRLDLRLTHRTTLAIVVALVALRHVFAKMALRWAELQAATAIALLSDQTSVVRHTNKNRATHHLVQVALFGHDTIRIGLRRNLAPTTFGLWRGRRSRSHGHPGGPRFLALRLRFVFGTVLLGLRLLRDGWCGLGASRPRRACGFLRLRSRLLFLRLRKGCKAFGQVRHLGASRSLARLLSATLEGRPEHRRNVLEVGRIGNVEATVKFLERAVDLSIQELRLDTQRHSLPLGPLSESSKPRD